MIGVTKAYCTRVGSGPFPSELHGAEGEQIRVAGNEFGSTTGRPRRCGWLDVPQLKYAVMITGTTHLAITKLDVLNDFDEIATAERYVIGGKETDQVPFDLSSGIERLVSTRHAGWMSSIEASGYMDLPGEVRAYLAYLERHIGVPVTYISTGPERDQLLVRE